MLTGRDITVLGGGIAGLTAAIALTRRGARVTVLEQAEAIREVGAGLQISPNGVSVLRALGLGDGVERIGLRAAAVSLRDYAAGREVLRLDLAQASGPYFFIHRADLVQMLADAARAAGVKLRLLQQIRSVRVGAEGASLTTAQGAVLNTRLLVGADGLHSVVRGALNGTDRPFFTGQVAWRALVPARGEAGAEARVYMGPGRHIVCYPLRGGELINLVAVQERDLWAEEGWYHRDDPANLRAAFADFGSEVQALLERVEEVYLWGLFRHPVAPVWHRGAAAILGDAAHPTLPFLAQGANMALEDAWVLAAALEAHDGVEAGLAAYQAARRDRCARIVEAASRNARNYHLSFPPLRAAAHAALRLGGRLAPDRMLGRFDWLYAHDVTRAHP
ncbi:MAG: FAD-dependent oxidoreductase [Paracoccaceae bacterium]